MSFQDVKSINFDDLKFSAPRSTTGKRFIKAFYNKKPLSIRLPKLKLPFDAQLSQYGQIETNISLGLNTAIIDKLQELDDKMMSFAVENGWFGNEDVDSMQYIPVLKKSKAGNYPPTFKVKISKTDAGITSKFFDSNKQPIEVNSAQDVLDLLKRGTHAISALECNSVWFIDNRFGLSWKVDQMRIYPNEQPEFTFGATSDDSGDECLIYE